MNWGARVDLRSKKVSGCKKNSWEYWHEQGHLRNQEMLGEGWSFLESIFPFLSGLCFVSVAVMLFERTDFLAQAIGSMLFCFGGAILVFFVVDELLADFFAFEKTRENNWMKRKSRKSSRE